MVQSLQVSGLMPGLLQGCRLVQPSPGSGDGASPSRPEGTCGLELQHGADISPADEPPYIAKNIRRIAGGAVLARLEGDAPIPVKSSGVCGGSAATCGAIPFSSRRSSLHG